MNATPSCTTWKSEDTDLLIYLRSRFPQDDWTAKPTPRMKKAHPGLVNGYHGPSGRHNKKSGSKRRRTKQRHPIVVRKLFDLSPIGRMIDTPLPMPRPLPCASYVDASQMLTSVCQTIVDGKDSREQIAGISSGTSPVENHPDTLSHSETKSKGQDAFDSPAATIVRGGEGPPSNSCVAATHLPPDDGPRWPIADDRTNYGYEGLITTSWVDAAEGIAPLDINVVAGEALGFLSPS